MSEHCIYVTLDSLLDTRLGTVALMDDEAAAKLVVSDAYYQRKVDDFEAITGITPTQFKEAYAKRDVTTLKHSMLTGVALMIDKVIMKLEVEILDSPHVSATRVELNLWPYQLEDDERIAIAEAMTVYSGKHTPVMTIWKPPKEITPQFIHSRYYAMFLYDFNEWFSCHAETFIQNRIPKTHVFAPALYLDKIPTPEEALVNVLPKATPFNSVELVLLDYMRLDLIEPSTFSIIRL